MNGATKTTVPKVFTVSALKVPQVSLHNLIALLDHRIWKTKELIRPATNHIRPKHWLMRKTKKLMSGSESIIRKPNSLMRGSGILMRKLTSLISGRVVLWVEGAVLWENLPVL